MANAPGRARGAAEGSGHRARSRRSPGQAGRADRLYHLLGIAAGKRRADPKLCRAPSGICGGAVIANHNSAVGQGGGFCRRHAAIGGRTFDDTASHRHGWIFCIDTEKEYAVLRVCEATRPVSRTGGAAFFTMHRRAGTQADAKRAKWTPDQQRTASRCAASGARISHPEARRAYAARGLAVLVADANTPLDGAIQYMAAIKRPVTVIGTSRGTLRAAE